MQSVHDIVEFQRRVRRLIYILTPHGSAYQNHGILIIFTDHGDDFTGIGLYAVPCGIAVGLVTDFVYNIGIIFIKRGYFPEKADGILLVHIGILIA